MGPVQPSRVPRRGPPRPVVTPGPTPTADVRPGLLGAPVQVGLEGDETTDHTVLGPPRVRGWVTLVYV